MTKILIHFPVIMAFLLFFLFLSTAMGRSFWFFIPAWQALCTGVILSWDGKNRTKRYERILSLVKQGRELSSLPREKTVCGFFIRLAVMRQTKPDRVR